MTVNGDKQAAVLVPIAERDGELRVVFTKRRHDLPHHPGEISFPGGRREQSDRDLIATALRESHEEIGLDPAGVVLAGALPPTPTFVTNYAIYPYVGVIAPDAKWTPEEAEVALILDLALKDVRAGYARERLVRRGIAFETDTYRVGEHLIWGATGRIVTDLLRYLDAVDAAT